MDGSITFIHGSRRLDEILKSLMLTASTELGPSYMRVQDKSGSLSVFITLIPS